MADLISDFALPQRKTTSAQWVPAVGTNTVSLHCVCSNKLSATISNLLKVRSLLLPLAGVQDPHDRVYYNLQTAG
jgi:hypothetical protein